MEAGRVVDGVSAVITLSEEAIEPVPQIVAAIHSAFLAGIARVSERLVVLGNLGQVLTIQESASLAA